MITDDYVSFETAKLLKEKGFDEKCHRYWQYDKANDKDDVDGICLYCCSGVSGLNNSELDIFFEESLLNFGYSAPTLQMAMKWLEEVHHIIVVADYEYECTDTSWYYKVYRLGENGKPERCTVKGVRYNNDKDGFVEEIVAYRDYDRSHKEYSTRKEACEAGIKHCLENLI